jgi:hypothetical protein
VRKSHRRGNHHDVTIPVLYPWNGTKMATFDGITNFAATEGEGMVNPEMLYMQRVDVLTQGGSQWDF